MTTISKATVDDFPEIYQLDQTIAEFCHDATQLVDSAMAWRTWVESGLIYKAVNDAGAIIGVVLAFYVKKRGWCVHKVLVANEYLQENIALEMLKKMLQKIDRREEKSYVIVHPHDLYAIKLYTLLGFNQQTLCKDYLGEREDRFILTRAKRWSDVQKSRKQKKRKSADNIWNIPRLLTDPELSGDKYIN